MTKIISIRKPRQSCIFSHSIDLEDLVTKAHSFDIKVFLDIVLHHSGDNWSYPGDENYYYYQGAIFPFGSWRSPDLPVLLS